MINNQGIKYIDPTDEASKEWKKRINALSDISLFPTTKSTYMGGSLPGKAFEQVNYAGGLGSYKDEIRSKLPGWQGFRVVNLDAKEADKQKERREKQVEGRLDEVVGAPQVETPKTVGANEEPLVSAVGAG